MHGQLRVRSTWFEAFSFFCSYGQPQESEGTERQGDVAAWEGTWQPWSRPVRWCVFLVCERVPSVMSCLYTIRLCVYSQQRFSYRGTGRLLVDVGFMWVSTAGLIDMRFPPIPPLSPPFAVALSKKACLASLLLFYSNHDPSSRALVSSSASASGGGVARVSASPLHFCYKANAAIVSAFVPTGGLSAPGAVPQLTARKTLLGRHAFSYLERKNF